VEITRRIAQWLLAQRSRDVGFRATQDTVMGLQALATYEMWTRGLVIIFISYKEFFDNSHFLLV